MCKTSVPVTTVIAPTLLNTSVMYCCLLRFSLLNHELTEFELALRGEASESKLNSTCSTFSDSIKCESILKLIVNTNYVVRDLLNILL